MKCFLSLQVTGSPLRTSPKTRHCASKQLSGAAAAGNCAHRYIGKVCCLLLVRADYIGRAPGRGPEGMGKFRGIAQGVITVTHTQPEAGRLTSTPSCHAGRRRRLRLRNRMFASPGDTVIPWRLMPGSTPWPPPRRRASEVRLSLEPSGGWASNPSGRTRLSLLARIGSLSSYVHGSNDALGPAGPYRHQGLARAPGGRRGRLGIGSQSRQSRSPLDGPHLHQR